MLSEYPNLLRDYSSNVPAPESEPAPCLGGFVRREPWRKADTGVYTRRSQGTRLPQSASGSTGNPLRFAARELDATTGLYYVRARWYDPAQGRFISEDPIGLAGGINNYAYAANDPVNLSDPTGLCVGQTYYVDWTTCLLGGVTSDGSPFNINSMINQEFSLFGGGVSGGLLAADLTPGEKSRLECITTHHVKEPARAAFLGMLNRGAVTTGSLPPGDDRHAFAFTPWFQTKTVFIGGPRGVIRTWHERSLAITITHELRHIMQQRTFLVQALYMAKRYDTVRESFEAEAEAWGATMLLNPRDAQGVAGGEFCPVAR